MKDIKRLQKENAELLERLKSSNAVIDNAAETIAEWFKTEEDRGDIYLELLGELAPNEDVIRRAEGEGVKFARQCNATNEGMDSGYVYNDGEMYFKHKEDLVKQLRADGVDKNNELSDDFIIAESYENETHYYTEWEDEDDFEYIIKDGKLILIED